MNENHDISGLKKTYGDAGIDFPLQRRETSVLDHSGQLDNRLTAARQNTTALLEKIYESPEHPVLIVNDIFQQVAPYFDTLFPKILAVKKEKQIEQSWDAYDPETAAQLKTKIAELRKKHKEYLSTKNRALDASLEYISHTFLSGKTPLYSDIQRLEKLAVIAYKERQPSLFFILSKYFSNVYDPDLRFVIPMEEETEQKYQKIFAQTWEAFHKLFPHETKNKRVPQVIVGHYVGGAGTQKYDMTSGEALYCGDTVLTPNTFKYRAEREAFYKLMGKTLPDNSELIQLLLYGIHEQGHVVFPDESGQLAELATDLPSIAIGLQLALDGKTPFTLEDFIASSAAEYIAQTDFITIGDGPPNEHDDGYKVSGRIISNLFFKHSLVRLNNDNTLSISTERQNVEACIAELKDLHESMSHARYINLEEEDLKPEQLTRHKHIIENRDAVRAQLIKEEELESVAIVAKKIIPQAA